MGTTTAAHMMGPMPGMGMMGPWMMGVVLLVGLLLLAAVLVGGVWLGRRLSAQERRGSEVGQGPARAELDRRYAAGEIDREEYLQRKVELDE
jgi:putative membrane protein